MISSVELVFLMRMQKDAVKLDTNKKGGALQLLLHVFHRSL